MVLVHGARRRLLQSPWHLAANAFESSLLHFSQGQKGSLSKDSAGVANTISTKHERIMQGKHFPLSFFSKSYVWGREICKKNRKKK